MQLSGREIDAVWRKFQMRISSSRDIHALLYDNDGRLILRTRRSHGSGKISGDIPNMIRQQMKLNHEQFAQAIACPLTREGYLQILRDKGVY